MCTFTVFDPENDNSQASAVGYFTANPPSFTNASLVQGLGAFNSISSTTVVGGVNTSGSSYIFYFKTDALAPGKVTADVNLPIAGLGAGLTTMKNLIINAVPAAPYSV